jgi:hypothetical protein
MAYSHERGGKGRLLLCADVFDPHLHSVGACGDMTQGVRSLSLFERRRNLAFDTSPVGLHGFYLSI